MKCTQWCCANKQRMYMGEQKRINLQYMYMWEVKCRLWKHCACICKQTFQYWPSSCASLSFHYSHLVEVEFRALPLLQLIMLEKKQVAFNCWEAQKIIAQQLPNQLFSSQINFLSFHLSINLSHPLPVASVLHSSCWHYFISAQRGVSHPEKKKKARLMLIPPNVS